MVDERQEPEGSMEGPQREPPVIERREFLKTAALAAGATMLCGVPLVSFVGAPAFEKSAGRWIDFGPIEELGRERIEMLPYEFMVKDGWQVLPQRGFVWARVEKTGTVTVLSSKCTHLACNVIWREEAGIFQCPCHSGRFDEQGRVIGGPPTRPLVRLDHQVDEGRLRVFLVTV